MIPGDIEKIVTKLHLTPTYETQEVHMAKFTRNLKRVESAFDRDRLAQVCVMDEMAFPAMYDMQTYYCEQSEPDDFYHFKDNGSNVLAVAHLDTVAGASQRRATFADTAAGPVVFSRALDDRLGAYIILDLLPSLGIQYDILLTTGEESGRSTAAFFDTPEGKDYDYMIEFDRGGTDVVMYQYDDDDTRAAVRRTGAQVGDGIFSDICYLEHLGIKGFNWGVGYRDYHGPKAHAYLDDTMMMVARYLKFHQQNEGVYMPHVPDRDSWYSSSRTRKSGMAINADWWDDDDTYVYDENGTSSYDDRKIEEADIFDIDYYCENPSLEDIQRLEERLDRERYEERLAEWDRGIVRGDEQHLYADWLSQKDRGDDPTPWPSEDDIAYQNWLSSQVTG